MIENDFLVPQSFNGRASVRCALSTRRGGVSAAPLGMNLSFRVGDKEENVKENRKRFFGSFGVSLDRLAIPRQCHSAAIQRADAPGAYDKTDGLVTDRPDVWLVVSVADCTPVFVVDRRKEAVGVFHAGWRGSAARIVEGGIQMMAREFGSVPSDMQAFIGPSAGACCYEVGDDVARRFTDGVVEKRNGSLYVDLKKENFRQLVESGVPEKQIEVSTHCTIHEDSLFHSYRRDRERSGRMMGFVGLVKSEDLS